jgi:DNA-directed RNA polymerase subunit RPC12/RpoP
VADAPTSPKVEHDERGHYLRCGHCGERVAMTPITTAQGRPGFRL